MKKVRVRFITLLSILMLFTLALGCFFAAPIGDFYASAYTPSNIFAQSTGGDVKAYKETASAEKAYTAFVMKDGGNVYYRRDLALKWFIEEKQANYFNMEFSFGALTFQELTFAFESAEENITKDGKTTNSVILKNNAGALTAFVKNSEEEESNEISIDAANGITLSFDETDCNIGEFRVLVNEQAIGSFTNVGGYFLEYRSSASSTPNTPITISAKMPEAAKDEAQKIFMKSLNGQTLEVSNGKAAENAEEDGTIEVTGGEVVDNAPAVLVLNQKVYAFTLGQKFSLDYEAIDVCDDSVSVNRYYYMNKKDAEGNRLNPDTAKTSADYTSLSTSTFFLPTDDKGDGETEYVSIRFFLDDGRKEEGDTRHYVYLYWYAEDNALEVLKDKDNKEFTYIKVDKTKTGPYYTGITPNATEKKNDIDITKFNDAKDAYAEAVSAAAENVSAGDGSYFYLPSLRGLIGSDYADYRNLKFSIYYYKESQTEGATAATATSLKYNALKFEIEEAGVYKFRVLAVDAAGNSMRYYLDGELVTVTSSNIWKFDEFPEFRFEAKYKGATIEEAGEQTLGYRDSEYSISNFTVIALSGIEKDYALYRLNEDKWTSEDELPDYSDFVKNVKDYMKEEKYLNCLEKVSEYNDEVEEDDDEWDKTDNAYKWNPSSSLSFVPQVKGLYVVELTVTDPNRSNEKKVGYQVINVQNPYDLTPGQSEWLQNNILSVVLFSISAVLAVIIVVLFLVKPSDKKVEEIDLEKLKGGKKKE